MSRVTPAECHAYPLCAHSLRHLQLTVTTCAELSVCLFEYVRECSGGSDGSWW